MKRLIYNDLVEWKNNPNHKPLILLGARQVGKTYFLKEFGANEFKNIVYVNCHQNEFTSNLFHNLMVKRWVFRGLYAFAVGDEAHLVGAVRVGVCAILESNSKLALK